MLESIADQAREVGRGWSGPDAEPGWALVAALFDRAGRRRELSRLAAEIPLERCRRCCSWPASSASSPIIPTTRSPGTTQGRTSDDRRAFAAALQRFAITRADELRRWFGRRYQMNEVGRCTQIALAVGVVQRLAPGRRVAWSTSAPAPGSDCTSTGTTSTSAPVGRSDRPTHRCSCTCAVHGDPHCRPGRRTSPCGSASTPRRSTSTTTSHGPGWRRARRPRRRRASTGRRHRSHSPRRGYRSSRRRSRRACIAAIAARARRSAGRRDRQLHGRLLRRRRAARHAHRHRRQRARRRVGLARSPRPARHDGRPLRAGAARRSGISSNATAPAACSPSLSIVASIGGAVTERVLATAHPSGTRMTWLG